MTSTTLRIPFRPSDRRYPLHVALASLIASAPHGSRTSDPPHPNQSQSPTPASPEHESPRWRQSDTDPSSETETSPPAQKVRNTHSSESHTKHAGWQYPSAPSSSCESRIACHAPPPDAQSSACPSRPVSTKHPPAQYPPRHT